MYQDTVLAAVPATRLVAVLNGGPPTRSGAGLRAHRRRRNRATANAAVFELVTVRLVPLPPCSVIAPPLMVEGLVVPVIEIDLCQQRLNAVGDVELVAGRAGGHECDRRAVDGDGVAGREALWPADPL